MRKEPRIEYLAGAADDGYGFLPVISCFGVTSQGKKRTRWVLHHPKEQFKLKDEALAAADALPPPPNYVARLGWSKPKL
jgi:hypothetical protein